MSFNALVMLDFVAYSKIQITELSLKTQGTDVLAG